MNLLEEVLTVGSVRGTRMRLMRNRDRQSIPKAAASQSIRPSAHCLTAQLENANVYPVHDLC
jgi:hypothetical protein